MDHNDSLIVSQDFLNGELERYEENVHMTPGEKRAVRKWVSSGHSVFERPASKYICSWCMPQEYDFLDVYRMDKELDAATKGMGKAEKTAYLKDYFGYTEPSVEELRWEEAKKNTPPMVRDDYIRISKESFWLWEFICEQGLREEATEFLQDHKNEEVPFVWEGSFVPTGD